MSAVKSKNISGVLSDFFAELQESSSTDSAFFIMVAMLEVLRRAKDSLQVCAIQKFVTAVSETDPKHSLRHINFSLTQNLLSPAYNAKITQAGAAKEDVPAVLTAAVGLLLDRLVHNRSGSLSDRQATITDMESSVDSIVSLLLGDEPPPPQVSQPVFFDTYNKPDYMTGPEITYEMLREINAEFISYRANMTSGELGPEIRGLSIEGPDGKLHTFLETGEYVQLKPGALGVAAYTDENEIKNFPVVLLLYAVLAADVLASKNYITREQQTLLQGGVYGLPVDPDPWLALAPADDLLPADILLHTYDNTSLGSDAVPPFVVEFAVDDIHAVKLSSVYSKTGSYIFTQLLDVTKQPEQVVMTHSVPRFFSVYGVYIFPLAANKLLGLIAIK